MTAAANPWSNDELEWDLTGAIEAATAFVAQGSLPCIVFGVIDAAGRREVIALSGPGADVRDDSVFFIASLTKAIVATAVMQYVEEDRLDLHAPLSRYVPGFSRDGRDEVTAWHVLTHTSGLPDIPPERLRDERPTYRRVLDQVLAMTPRWQPGTRYEYGSAAWVLLSESMAGLSGIAFPGVMEQRLLRPLGMADTTFDARPLRQRVVPVGGTRSNPIIDRVLLRFLARSAFPGGGLFATVPDLLRFGWAMLAADGRGPGRARALAGTTVERMARSQIAAVPHVAEDGSVSHVEQGLGWRKAAGQWPPGDRVLTHGSATGGRLWVDPERDFAFALLTNLWGATSEAAVAVLREVYRART